MTRQRAGPGRAQKIAEATPSHHGNLSSIRRPFHTSTWTNIREAREQTAEVGTRASASAVSSGGRHSSCRARRTRSLAETETEAGSRQSLGDLGRSPGPGECGLARPDLPRGPGQGWSRAPPRAAGPQAPTWADVHPTEWKDSVPGRDHLDWPAVEAPLPWHSSANPSDTGKHLMPLLRSSMGWAAPPWWGPQLQSVPCILVTLRTPRSESCFPLAGVAACASAGTTTCVTETMDGWMDV